MPTADFLVLAASALGVESAALSLWTSYGSIPEWDSLAQLRLVLEIEKATGVRYDLAEVAAIRTLAGFYAKVSPKKVLALDLDGTLWEGVIGEDGPGGIRPRTDVQRAALEVKRRGGILIALSKNNAADVTPAWTVPGMLLSPSDFALLKIDWNAKADNLRAAAAELNLGADSFVFVDDRGAERERMVLAAPEVVTLDPESDFLSLFPAGAAPTLDRTALYRAEGARRASAAALSREEYLQRLELSWDIRPLAPGDCPRVAELAQRANQFNVTTRRLSLAEVEAFVGASDRVALTMRARDRFGDLGLIAFVNAELRGASAAIVDFFMSCRAMDRELEFRLEEALEAELRRRGIRELSARYLPTAKNAPVKELFPSLGFTATTAGTYSRRLSPQTFKV